MKKKFQDLFVKELKAVAEAVDVDLTGVSRKAEIQEKIRKHLNQLGFVQLVDFANEVGVEEGALDGFTDLAAGQTAVLDAEWEIPTSEEPDIVLDEPEDAPRRNWIRVARATGALLLAPLGALILFVAVAAAPRGFRAVRNWVAPQPTPAVVVDTDADADIDVVEEQDAEEQDAETGNNLVEVEVGEGSHLQPWAEGVEEEEILRERPSVGDTLDVEGEEALVVAEVLVPAQLAYVDLRAEIAYRGDTAAYVIRFAEETWGPLTLLRAVPDDEFVWLKVCRPDGCEDLLPLLSMVEVTESKPTAEIRDYMVARGMEDASQQLPQNQHSVQFEAASEVWLEVVMKDDPTEGVNRGGLISFSGDTDPYTWISEEDGYELAGEMASYILD